MVLLILISLFQTQIEINEHPTNSVSIELKHYSTIKNGEDGFYYKAVATATEKGEIVVYDQGNHQISVFDKDGNKQLTFGKQGNGPGEFSQAASDLQVVNNLICVFTYEGIALYKMDGDYVKDIKINKNKSDYAFFTIENGFRIQNLKNYKSRAYIYKDYDINGNKISEKKNKDYSINIDEEEHYDIVENTKNRFSSPKGFVEYKEGYLSYMSGKFRLKYFDLNQKSYTEYFKKMKRVKYVKKKLFYEKELKKVPKQFRAELLKEAKILNKTKDELSGGYKSDIKQLIGTYKNYIFLLVNTDNKEQNFIDVLSPNFKYLCRIGIIKGQGLYNYRIHKGKLIFTVKDDEIGPYIKVFDIIIN